MSEWKEVKLGDVCEIKKDKILVTELTLNNYISTENMLPNKRGIQKASSLPTTKQVTFFETGNILFSNIRTYFKKIWYAKFNGGASNDVIVFKNKDLVNSKFLYYIISSDRFINYSVVTSKGTKMPRGDKTALMNFKFLLPPLPTQKKIADILSIIDEKIETLQNINETLEEMAKVIFKSWFVDFDIVKAKANGKSNKEISKEFGISEEVVKLFPSEFVESEIGKIPHRWKVGNFEKDCNIVYGKNLPKSKLKEKGYPVFGANGIIGYYNEFLYETPQIIIGCRGIAGKVNISLPNAFITNNSLIIEIKNELLTFEYMKELVNFTDFSIYATGSVQPQITITNIKQHKFLIPSKKTIDYFTKITSNFNNIYFNNLFEIQTLQELRDTLLPKLINGEIEIDELDIRDLE